MRPPVTHEDTPDRIVSDLVLAGAIGPVLEPVRDTLSRGWTGHGVTAQAQAQAVGALVEALEAHGPGWLRGTEVRACHGPGMEPVGRLAVACLMAWARHRVSWPQVARLVVRAEVGRLRAEGFRARHPEATESPCQGLTNSPPLATVPVQ